MNGRFSPEEDAVVLALRGIQTAELIGQRIGRSADAVRRRWRNLGLTPTKPLNDSQKRKAALCGKSDAELIQLHLERKGITRCPPGIAAGVTPLELHTGFTAQPPPSLSYREKMAKLVDAARRRAA